MSRMTTDPTESMLKKSALGEGLRITEKNKIRMKSRDIVCVWRKVGKPTFGISKIKICLIIKVFVPNLRRQHVADTEVSCSYKRYGRN